jgi:hypothetical protein
MRAFHTFIGTVGSFLFLASMQTELRAQTMDDQNATSTTARRDPSRDSAGQSEKVRSDRDEDHFRLGVLGGFGFPRPLAIEGMVKVERALGLGVEYSVLPSFSVDGVETTFHALAADARLFPLRGPFFIGIRAGHQHLGAAGTVAVNGLRSAQEVTVDSTFVNPRIGFLWTFEPGFTVGIDAGAQIPLTSTISSSLPTGTVANEQAMRVANTLGASVIPTIDLLRLGFLL